MISISPFRAASLLSEMRISEILIDDLVRETGSVSRLSLSFSLWRSINRLSGLGCWNRGEDRTVHEVKASAISAVTYFMDSVAVREFWLFRVPERTVRHLNDRRVPGTYYSSQAPASAFPISRS